MTPQATVARKRLRELIKQIPESELHAAQRYLEFLVTQEEHPAITTLSNLPLDDEPVSEEALEGIRQGLEDIQAGRVVSFEDIWQELVENERPKAQRR